MKKQLIKYFKSLGIEVYTNTKARGHQGFFLKNRIDISKNTKEERIIPTLLHEFAHFIHAKIEPDMPKNGGDLVVLFDLETPHLQPLPHKGRGEQSLQGSLFSNLFNKKHSEQPSSIAEQREPLRDEASDPVGAAARVRVGAQRSGEGLTNQTIKKELLAVTNFVDSNSHHAKLLEHKNQIKKRIKFLEAQIKQDYPNFMRSKKFKEFDKYIKKSKAKYLLKYDRVKLISPFLRHVEVFSIDNLERDFPDMQPAFCTYIRLKSAQKKQARISAKINKLNKYYEKPAELFARLVEGLFINPQHTQELAPFVTKRFYELLAQNYYFELKEVLNMLEKETEKVALWS